MNSANTFRIKICGVRSPADVAAAAEAGADAVGINFHPPSCRYVSPEDPRTRALAVAAAEHGVKRIGVVVNRTVAEIERLQAAVPLDAVQLHGDETLADAERLIAQGIAVIRAVRLPSGPLAADRIQAAVAPWRSIGCGVLIDADSGAAYGGTGSRLDWDALAAWSSTLGAGTSWMLAGGLTPQSVAEAIRRARPHGVDVASGVERVRGQKCPLLIRDFCVAAAGPAALPPAEPRQREF